MQMMTARRKMLRIGDHYLFFVSQISSLLYTVDELFTLASKSLPYDRMLSIMIPVADVSQLSRFDE